MKRAIWLEITDCDLQLAAFGVDRVSVDLKTSATLPARRHVGQIKTVSVLGCQPGIEAEECLVL
ncbi:hypothetical protein D3C73_1438330 [compost metagenome]